MNDQSQEKHSPSDPKLKKRDSPITLRDAALQPKLRRGEDTEDNDKKATRSNNSNSAVKNGSEDRMVASLDSTDFPYPCVESKMAQIEFYQEYRDFLSAIPQVLTSNFGTDSNVSKNSSRTVHRISRRRKSKKLEPKNRSMIPGFHLAEHLGTGRLFNVFLAVNQADPQCFRTMRIFRHDIADHILMAEQLERNIETQQGLQHPNLLTIKTTGYIDGEIYILADFVDGLSLASLLATKQQIPLGVVAAIFFDVLRGLNHLHRFGEEGLQVMAHGYLCPENILIGYDGVTRVSGMEWGTLKATRGENVSEVLHLAPENITRGELVPKTDLFQVASIIHECIVGQPAFEADTVEKVLSRILLEPMTVSSDVNILGAEAILKALIPAFSKRVGDRYASAELMSKHLLSATLEHGEFAHASEVARFVDEAYEISMLQNDPSSSTRKITLSPSDEKVSSSHLSALRPDINAANDSFNTFPVVVADQICKPKTEVDCSLSLAHLQVIAPCPFFDSKPIISSEIPSHHSSNSLNIVSKELLGEEPDDDVPPTLAKPPEFQKKKGFLFWLKWSLKSLSSHKETAFKVAFMLGLGVIVIKYFLLP